LKEKEPKWFAERLAELQDAANASAAQVGAVEWDGMSECPVCHRWSDEESEPEPVEKLIEELLAELGEEEARENAEFVARPDAVSVGASLQRRLRESLEREERLKQRLRKIEGR
jgi:hypothetical protein